MSKLENKIFNTINKTNIYLRYVDDIFILTNSTNEINIIQENFQNDSVLNFTQELYIVGVSPLLMDSPSRDIYRLSSLLRSLGEPSPRTVIFMILLS